jgi:hypothetical protein
MAAKNVEAFALYNEKETAVESIVNALESRGVSTHFWRRDVPYGEGVEELEVQRFRDALTVLVFLGAYGWGPNHLRLTKEAQSLQKRIIPVLIGDPPEGAFQEASALFRDRRYLDLRDPDPATLAELVDAVRRREPSQAGLFDRIVGVLIDGNEEQRADVLHQVVISTSIDRPALAARLRAEIRDRFGPGSESQRASALRDTKSISSIRSWMLSSLIWADAEAPESRDLILRQLQQSYEPDRKVRYWTLAGLYQIKASFLDEAVKVSFSDDAPEVNALARAIASPQDPAVIERFRSDLASEEFETAWQVLRLLRVVPIPELAADVCARLDRSAVGSRLAYDTLYALSHPEMARVAAEILSREPGLDGVVARVIAESRDSTPNSIRNFSVLLAAFDGPGVDRALAEAARDPETSAVAARLRENLNAYRRRRGAGQERFQELSVAGYASDTIDVREDPLDIREDVQTLTTVMLAKEVTPPLAIGLFGDWGSGKSFFMQSMKAATNVLASRAKGSAGSRFCSDIVSIEFNAWHYADANLWASLVSTILTQLAAYVTPQLTAEQQQAALLSELGSAKAVVAESKAEKQRVETLMAERQGELQQLQRQREETEVRLLDLRASDLQDLLSGQVQLKKDLEESLDQIGAPAAFHSASELSRVVSEAHTLHGRVIALLLTVVRSRNRVLFWGLLVVVLLVIPLIAGALHTYVTTNGLVVWVSALVSQVIVVVSGVTAVLRKAVETVRAALARAEKAKQEVDRLIAAKRRNPTPEEVQLQQQVTELTAKEQEAATRLSAAADRVRALEQRILALEEGRSLARFLAERTGSEDYRKHLGLVSTIRQDFESLAQRLANGRTGPGAGSRPVDRIILYIDDLDRCPADKVMEVLQAVHLLLAYPLFVVVVGVDPRWLLHSLGTTYSAFQGDGRRFGTDPDLWRTTPQNYLEKIFQIPFSLRPMTETGYGKLMERLLKPAAPPAPEDTRGSPPATPTATVDRGPSSAAPTSGPPTSSGQVGEPGQGRVAHLDEAPDFVVHEESLVIKAWEAQFAERLFALIPTPRAAKRFSNVYRILKAPVRRGDLPRFEGTAEVPGDFQVPMLLLAVLIGAPSEGAALFPRLLKRAANGHDPADLLQRFKALGLDSPSSEALEDKIRPIVADGAFPHAPEVFVEWVPRVSRFSFEVGRAVRPVAAAGPDAGMDASESRSVPDSPRFRSG